MPKRTFVAPVLIVAFGLAFAVAPAVAGEKVLRDDWSAAYLMGKKLGWNHDKAVEKELDGRTVVVTSTRLEIRMARMGETIEIVQASEVVETLEGALVSFWSRQKQSAMEMAVKGVVESGKIRITRTVGGSEQPGGEGPLDPEALPPQAMFRLMKEKGLVAGTAYKLRSFITDSPLAAVEVSVKVVGPQEVSILDTKRTLTLVETTMAIMGQKITAKQWLDAEWTQWKLSVPAMQMDLIKLPKDLATVEGEIGEVFLQLLIPPDRKIEGARELRKLSLRLELPEGEAFEGFPASARQEQKGQGPGFLELLISAADPKATLPLPVKADGMDSYLAATPFLQKDDSRIAAIAQKAVGTETDSLKAARALERWVFENIKKKNMGVGFATAAEVAKNLEGDCSEHGVLLAALCRAAGVPSRVVGGLVYAEELKAPGVEDRGAFGFHMWTEVFVGEWVALDATLGVGFADATHIALATSAMKDESSQFELTPIGRYMGKLSIKILE